MGFNSLLADVVAIVTLASLLGGFILFLGSIGVIPPSVWGIPRKYVPLLVTPLAVGGIVVLLLYYAHGTQPIPPIETVSPSTPTVTAPSTPPARATATATAVPPATATVTPAARKIWAYQTGAQIGVAAAVGGSVVYTISQDGYLYAFDQRSGAPLWHLWVGESGDPWSDPQLVNGMLYFGTYDGHVEAVSVSSRSVIWSTALGAAVGSAPTISGQTLYVGCEDHNVYALDLTTGQQLLKMATGGAVDGSPVVSGGMLYIGSSDGYLYALRLSDLSVVWRQTSGSGAFDSTLLLYNSVLYYAAGHSFTAWNPTTGAKLWQSSLSGVAYRLPATDGNRLYVGTDDGYVTALNLDGSLAWHVSVPAGDGATPNIRSTIVVYQGGLYFGSWNHHVYRLDAATGAVDWSFTTGDYVEGEVAIAGGVLYVGSHDGKLYALRA